jgi:hypothetical protein
MMLPVACTGMGARPLHKLEVEVGDSAHINTSNLSD